VGDGKGSGFSTQRSRLENGVRAIRRALLSHDTWSRHRIAAAFLGSPASVLDVGGVQGLLALFLPRARIVTVNVEDPTDVIFSGGRLPFPDSSFEGVTSLDVLEHIAPADRADHLAELARVATKTIVLCCPLGTKQHRSAEESLARWYEDLTGGRHRYLEEHLANGMPTETELRRLAEGAGLQAEFAYHGDFRETMAGFRLGMRARHEWRPDLAARYVATRVAPSHRLECCSPEPTDWTNRVFMVAHAQAWEPSAPKPHS
jgi:hypothetical protein